MHIAACFIVGHALELQIPSAGLKPILKSDKQKQTNKQTKTEKAPLLKALSANNYY